MLTFKQRYKPRTTREYTKSDLTVYDSAGNTALNALKVYGKSEVVDGAIVSAGEGWATVDLGTLNWNYISWQGVNYISSNTISAVCKHAESDNVLGRIVTSVYPNVTRNSITTSSDHVISLDSNGNINVVDSTYSDATTFKTAMTGVLLCYQLADPTRGNCIAVKTDNGTGIDGTMAVFETGTPLYGIDENTRDVMTWDGSSGEVTKNYKKVRLADLTWQRYQNRFFASNLRNTIAPYVSPNTIPNILSNKYRTMSMNGLAVTDKSMSVDNGNDVEIKDLDYSEVSDFVAALGDAELVYELATPTTEQLTTAENASIAGLRTFANTTHFTNNAGTDMTVNYTIRVPTIN